MSNLHRKIEKLWWSNDEPPLLLRLIEPVYSAISNRHLNQRAAKPIIPPLPVISVGNITAEDIGNGHRIPAGPLREPITSLTALT